MSDLSRHAYRSREFIEQAMEQWSSTVFKLAFAQTASRVDAEDVHQEVFIRLFKNASTFNDGEHLKAWLIRVTINCCHDLARSAWRSKVTTVEELEDFACESDTLSLHAMHDLAQALEELSEDMRAAVHLYYYEGYSSEEIAQFMGVTASTIRSRLERARKQLKTQLEGTKNGSREYL